MHLEEVVEDKTQQVNHVSSSLSKVQQENFQRLHDLKHFAMQTEPFVAEMACQVMYISVNYFSSCSRNIIGIVSDICHVSI